MITVLRKHRQWLMIVILILAIPFIFYFVQTPDSAIRSTDLGEIYDRPVTNVEFQRSARFFTLAQMLGLPAGTGSHDAPDERERCLYQFYF